MSSALSSGGERALASPFATAGPYLAETWDLPVLPLDGKRPMFKAWQRMACGIKQVSDWAEKYPDANVGLKTGSRSHLTVIDIDDMDQAEKVIDLCGDTPMQARTPRGGLHLYYRHRDEANRTGVIPGVDVRGEGGVVAAPPSYRRGDPSDSLTGRLYAFCAGDWHSIPDLPPVRDSGLAELDRMTHSAPTEVGNRNNALFHACMSCAPSAHNVEALMDYAAAINAKLPEPLPSDEVARTARSAWRYQLTGRNWIGSNKDREVKMGLYQSNPDAALLLSLLRDHHGLFAKPFAVSPKAMADAALIGKWAAARYRKAIRALVDSGIIEQVHEGGAGPGDPSKYQWCKRGYGSYPNKQEHGCGGGEGH
ncbi:MAG: bifunctional DNA primase/polymerase [Minwuia sp.]|nr:bifunctional DNA primase/polymerase [Minwuia sp.]